MTKAQITSNKLKLVQTTTAIFLAFTILFSTPVVALGFEIDLGSIFNPKKNNSDEAKESVIESKEDSKAPAIESSPTSEKPAVDSEAEEIDKGSTSTPVTPAPTPTPDSSEPNTTTSTSSGSSKKAGSGFVKTTSTTTTQASMSQAELQARAQMSTNPELWDITEWLNAPATSPATGTSTAPTADTKKESKPKATPVILSTRKTPPTTPTTQTVAPTPEVASATINTPIFSLPSVFAQAGAGSVNYTPNRLSTEVTATLYTIAAIMILMGGAMMTNLPTFIPRRKTAQDGFGL